MTNPKIPHVLDAKGHCPQGCNYARDGDTHWPHRYDDRLYRGGRFKFRWPTLWCVRWWRSLNRIAAERDAAVARAEQAEQAVARVRELASKFDRDITIVDGEQLKPVYSGPVVANRIRRALDDPAAPAAGKARP